MPQMKPMNWMFLFLWINSMFYLNNIMIFFNKNFINNKNNYKKMIYKNMNWKW
uniref:ATP synthase F0 subunit 8 n=1 Tax=Asphondylia rosetta TaxID=420168 RepID=C7FIM0_9DIPT|nr:ATP synthase F0 subunit 8 [Asphondylia rosetta]